jgi:superoxide reductase
MKERYMAEPKFYICRKCGTMVGKIVDKCDSLTCCGQPMAALKANTTDGASEKHVPAVTVAGNTVTVKVGSVDHPMADDHWIQWIYLQTEKGGQRKSLNPGEKPEAVFVLENDRPVAAYEYCNKHGLWKADIK